MKKKKSEDKKYEVNVRTVNFNGVRYVSIDTITELLEALKKEP